MALGLDAVEDLCDLSGGGKPELDLNKGAGATMEGIRRGPELGCTFGSDPPSSSVLNVRSSPLNGCPPPRELAPDAFDWVRDGGNGGSRVVFVD